MLALTRLVITQWFGNIEENVEDEIANNNNYGRQNIRCLIDTGSDKSIIKSSVLSEDYEKEKMAKPLWYRTILGTAQIKYKVTTPNPKQFLAKRTLTWKASKFKNKNYDAIVGKNFLILL